MDIDKTWVRRTMIRTWVRQMTSWDGIQLNTEGSRMRAKAADDVASPCARILAEKVQRLEYPPNSGLSLDSTSRYLPPALHPMPRPVTYCGATSSDAL
jgi:hypothetical protein